MGGNIWETEGKLIIRIYCMKIFSIKRKKSVKLSVLKGLLRLQRKIFGALCNAQKVLICNALRQASVYFKFIWHFFTADIVLHAFMLGSV